VPDIEVPPTALEVFDDQPAMAMMRCVFAAQETATRQDGGVNLVFNAAFLHKPEKASRKNSPADFFVKPTVKTGIFPLRTASDGGMELLMAAI
jgi:hypothetical protein